MTVNITYEMQKEWLLKTAAEAVRAGQRAQDEVRVAEAQMVIDTVEPLPAEEVAALTFTYSNDLATGVRIAVVEA